MYIFNSKNVDGQQLVPIINLLLGKDVVGAEVGTLRGQTACTLLQNCPSIKKLYVIDFWKPYSDFLKVEQDGLPAYSVDEKDIEFIKVTALHNFKYCGYSEKIEILDMDSNIAASMIENNSLDFVFLDVHMTTEQIKNDLIVWYDKVKTNGIIAVHDCIDKAVYNAIIDFLKEKNDGKKYSIFDNTFMWIKEYLKETQ